MHLLERIACSVKCNEPVLLVGETGTGKTTLVQYLAMKLTQKLTVLVYFLSHDLLFTVHLVHAMLTEYEFDFLLQNLSQQSDVADLLGGFKPMDARFICFPLYKEFEDLFSKTFSMKVSFL